eukprot:TRINITY_DN9015_c0_g1_i1.p1 TRINITY_DN9015_c0_g1~~TRINITY_DN9015_c0_g1_i1.p1  ORF type:complete len:555 (+),score=108.70 TRINITY_DN9015_c0_g1_i1:118-1782(+)
MAANVGGAGQGHDGYASHGAVGNAPTARNLFAEDFADVGGDPLVETENAVSLTARGGHEAMEHMDKALALLLADSSTSSQIMHSWIEGLRPVVSPSKQMQSLMDTEGYVSVGLCWRGVCLARLSEALLQSVGIYVEEAVMWDMFFVETQAAQAQLTLFHLLLAAALSGERSLSKLHDLARDQSALTLLLDLCRCGLGHPSRVDLLAADFTPRKSVGNLTPRDEDEMMGIGKVNSLRDKIVRGRLTTELDNLDSFLALLLLISRPELPFQATRFVEVVEPTTDAEKSKPTQLRQLLRPVLVQLWTEVDSDHDNWLSNVEAKELIHLLVTRPILSLLVKELLNDVSPATMHYPRSSLLKLCHEAVLALSPCVRGIADKVCVALDMDKDGRVSRYEFIHKLPRAFSTLLLRPTAYDTAVILVRKQEELHGGMREAKQLADMTETFEEVQSPVDAVAALEETPIQPRANSRLDSAMPEIEKALETPRTTPATTPQASPRKSATPRTPGSVRRSQFLAQRTDSRFAEAAASQSCQMCTTSSGLAQTIRSFFGVGTRACG